MRRTLSVLFILIFQLAFCFPALAEGVGQNEIEEKLKAAFVLNFAKFTRWPGDSTAGGNGRFNFCLFASEAGHEAFQGFSAKKVLSKPVRIIEVGEGDVDFDQCQVVYISQFAGVPVESILGKSLEKPVLTISDIAGFVQSGGMIEFIRTGDRLGFIINKSGAGRGGLEFNASLLNLASEVQ